MSFSETALNYLETAKNYNSMLPDKQAEARHMMQAYEKILKDSCPKLCMADLPLLLRLTETNLVIKTEDAELADLLFRRTIELSGSNPLVIANYSEFLNIHGWDLESIQLKTYLAEKDYAAARAFISRMVTFAGGRAVNQLSAPDALTAFEHGRADSAFSYAAKHCADFIRREINAGLFAHKNMQMAAVLNEKLKLFIPCANDKDLYMLHEFTVGGLARHLYDHDTAFALFEKNMELEPDSTRVSKNFCRLLAHIKSQKKIS